MVKVDLCGRWCILASTGILAVTNRRKLIVSVLEKL